jgi:hypothetical protein
MEKTKVRSTRALVVKVNRYNLGLDVGWRFIAASGMVVWEHMWGRTKDEDSLSKLCLDLRSRGFEFYLIRDAS